MKNILLHSTKFYTSYCSTTINVFHMLAMCSVLILCYCSTVVGIHTFLLFLFYPLGY
jgi:hypothetical protein